MAIEIHKFLVSLAAAIAALQAPALVLGTSMWIDEADDDKGGDLYALLRQYSAPSQASFVGNARVGRCSIQVMVRGHSSLAANDLAWRIHESLLVNSAPRSRWTIAGKQLVNGAVVVDATGWLVKQIVFVNGPGSIGRDETNKFASTFSLDVAFERAAAV